MTRIGANNARRSGPGVRSWSRPALEQEAIDLGLAEWDQVDNMSDSYLIGIIEEELYAQGKIDKTGSFKEDHEFGEH